MMTDEELGDEWRYRYLERLGLLCGISDPSTLQLKLAIADADLTISLLEKLP